MYLLLHYFLELVTPLRHRYVSKTLVWTLPSSSVNDLTHKFPSNSDSLSYI